MTSNDTAPSTLTLHGRGLLGGDAACRTCIQDIHRELTRPGPSHFALRNVASIRATFAQSEETRIETWPRR